MDLRLLARLKTRDAAVLYEWLFEQNNRTAGELRDLTFGSIAAGLNSCGLTTGRGSAFTDVVVRNRFKELEDVEIVERVETAPGCFNVFVFLYAGAEKESAEPIAEPTPDPYNGRTLFDYPSEQKSETQARADCFRFQNDNENENDRSENRKALNKDYININKKINNKRLEVEGKQEEVQEIVEASADDRPSASDVRKMIDFDAPKVAAFRAEVVKRAWEPSINPDLIDRVVAIAVLKIGGKRVKDCYAMIAEAKDAVRLYERTDGRAGRPTIWQTLAFSTKRIYDVNGWRWTPTRIGDEPRPERETAVAATLKTLLEED